MKGPPRIPGKWFVIAIPALWLLFYFALPFLIVLKISFAEQLVGQPPFTDMIDWSDGWPRVTLSMLNYKILMEDDIYVVAVVNSLKVAGISTILCLLVGYPMAYAIARAPASWRTILLLLVILPFWTSFLIRVYAWIGILKDNGILNNALMSLGLISEPFQILYTEWAIYIGIVYAYLPFMVLPLYAQLEKHEPALLEAAADLGCRPLRAFWEITLPISLPGVIAGSALVFIPAAGEYVIPELLGGKDALMIGSLMTSEFFSRADWPLASAIAVALLIALVGPILAFQRGGEAEQR